MILTKVEHIMILHNTDDDNIPDYLDTDTDGDEIDDIIEGNDLDYNHIADFLPVGLDSDGDGLDDAYDTVDLTSSSTNKYLNAAGSNVPLQDWDNNNLRDWRDPVPTNPTRAINIRIYLFQMDSHRMEII